MSECLEVIKFKDPKLGTKIVVDRLKRGTLCLVLEQGSVEIATWKNKCEAIHELKIKSNPFTFPR